MTSAKSSRKRLRNGPWKLRRSDDLQTIEIRPHGRDGDIELYFVGYKEYERLVADGMSWTEGRREEHPTVTLNQMLEVLELSDKKCALIELMKSGLFVVMKLHQRYSWYLRKAEEKEKSNRVKNAERDRKRRERERLEEKRYKARQARERKAKKDKELAEKRSQREAAKAQRLKAQALSKEKREKEAALKRATAESKKLMAAKQKQEAEIVQFRSSFWKKPHSRNIEI